MGTPARLMVARNSTQVDRTLNSSRTVVMSMAWLLQQVVPLRYGFNPFNHEKQGNLPESLIKQFFSSSIPP